MDRFRPDAYWFKRSDPWNVTPQSWQGGTLTRGLLVLLLGGPLVMSEERPLLYGGYMAGGTALYISIAWWTCDPQRR